MKSLTVWSVHRDSQDGPEGLTMCPCDECENVVLRFGREEAIAAQQYINLK